VVLIPISTHPTPHRKNGMRTTVRKQIQEGKGRKKKGKRKGKRKEKDKERKKEWRRKNERRKKSEKRMMSGANSGGVDSILS
jgi:hypothetical protein